MSSHLLSLPEELIATISDFILVDTLLSFALTCTGVYRHVKPRLARNQNYHDIYRVRHDRTPLEAPELLRLSLRDPEAIWHLRAFESWGLRRGWADWKDYKLEWYTAVDNMVHKWPEMEHDYSHCHESFFAAIEELKQFQKLMHETLHMTLEDSEFWIQKVREGWDGPLKGMLFAMAPRIDRLNFIAHESWHPDEVYYEGPLKFLAAAISSTYSSIDKGGIWPPGFEFLRMVSVCTPTNFRHPHDAFYAAPSRVAPLFLLPNIRVLNLTLLGYLDEPNPDFFLPPECSTVEDLAFFYCDMSLQAYVKFLTAPKRLRSFLAATSSMGNADSEVFRVLAKRHGEHLEKLSFGNYEGQLAGLAQNFPHLKELERLQVTSLLREEAGEDALRFRPECVDPVLAATEENSRSSLQVADLREFLPHSIERLGLLHDNKIGALSPSLVSAEMLRNVVDLVEDPRYICLNQVCLSCLKPEASSTGWDIEVLRRIEGRGIETHLVGEDRHEMAYESHSLLHRDGNPGLVSIESDPRSQSEHQNSVD